LDVLKRISKSIIFRLKIVYSALLSRSQYLPRFSQPTPDEEVKVEIYGWANFFDLFPHLRRWRGSAHPYSLRNCRNRENPQSTEVDVVNLLYDLARMFQAKRIIEVGIYKGASSLTLAQALADNGGGEIHLVDISAENLADVHSKINELDKLVTVHLHHGDSVAIAGQGILPQSDLVFLDADHRYEPVQNDIASYLPLVATGGILVIHDTVMWEGTRSSANGLFRDEHRIATLATSGGSGVSLIYKAKGMECKAHNDTTD
jgi:predicted O-methyltransferase YrrM